MDGLSSDHRMYYSNHLFCIWRYTLSICRPIQNRTPITILNTKPDTETDQSRKSTMQVTRATTCRRNKELCLRKRATRRNIKQKVIMTRVFIRKLKTIHHEPVPYTRHEQGSSVEARIVVPLGFLALQATLFYTQPRIVTALEFLALQANFCGSPVFHFHC